MEARDSTAGGGVDALIDVVGVAGDPCISDVAEGVDGAGRGGV